MPSSLSHDPDADILLDSKSTPMAKTPKPCLAELDRTKSMWGK